MTKPVSSSVFLYLPPGKPDPQRYLEKAEEKGKGSDSEARVLQEGQKGHTCLFYAGNYVRNRCGKSFPPNSRERIIEKTFSEVRKQITHISKPSEEIVENSETLVKIFQSLSDDGKITPTLVKERIGSDKSMSEKSKKMLLEAIDTFLEKDLPFGPLHFGPFVVDYFHSLADAADKIFKAEHRKILEAFLQRIPLFNPSVKQKEFWDKLKPNLQYLLLCHNFYLAFCAHFNLDFSPWKPSQKIGELIESLKSHGPHLVSGMFGKAYYDRPPFALKDKVHGHTIMGWKPDAKWAIKEDVSHTVVLVGAGGGRVYFIDPSGKNDPKSAEKMPLFTISYERLKKGVVELSHAWVVKGHEPKEEEMHYALYGPNKSWKVL